MARQTLDGSWDTLPVKLFGVVNRGRKALWIVARDEAHASRIAAALGHVQAVDHARVIELTASLRQRRVPEQNALMAALRPGRCGQLAQRSPAADQLDEIAPRAGHGRGWVLRPVDAE